MAPREKYLSSTITVSFPTAICSVPLPDSKHRNRKHTLELRLRNRNLSAINSPAVIRSLKLPPVIFPLFLDLVMKYDLVFGYFGWIGIDLDVCFDDLGFSVTVCSFQILMLFVFL